MLLASDSMYDCPDDLIDRKIALGGTVVPYMMQILLELPRAGYTLELIMKAMRSGMLRVPPYIADSFENYCYAKNIIDNGRIFDPDAYIDSEDERGRRPKTWIIANTVPGYNEGFTDSGKFFYEYVVERTLVPLKKACETINHTVSEAFQHWARLNSPGCPFH